MGRDGQAAICARCNGIRGDRKKDDVIIEAWLGAPDKSYIEINLHRFVVEEGSVGVKAYQFAQKVPMLGGKGDPTSYMKRRNSRFTELGKLKLDMQTSMR